MPSGGLEKIRLIEIDHLCAIAAPHRYSQGFFLHYLARLNILQRSTDPLPLRYRRELGNKKTPSEDREVCEQKFARRSAIREPPRVCYSPRAYTHKFPLLAEAARNSRRRPFARTTQFHELDAAELDNNFPARREQLAGRRLDRRD